MAQSGNTIPNAQAVIKRFGGIRPMATKMDVAVTTVQGWGKRNAIPENRRAEIIKAAEKHAVSLSGLKGFATEAAKPNASTQPKKVAAKNTAKKTTARPAAKPTVSAQPRARTQPIQTPETVQAEQSAAPQKPQTQNPQTTPGITIADLEAVRRESLRSGAVAATLIAGVITVTGLALFGGQGDNPDAVETARVAALETRVNSVEATAMGLDQRIGQVN